MLFKKTYIIFILFFMGAFSSQLIASTETQRESGAHAFVQTMTDNGLKFLSDKTLTKEQKSKKFKSLLSNSFDIYAIGKFAVGRYWRKMTPSQQKEYMTLFKSMLIDVYSTRFDEYQGQSVKLLKSISLSEKDTLVKSKIIDPDNASNVPVDWRVRHQNGRYRIIDVMVAGVSMSVTQRSDFSSVIQRGGGDVSVLINHLKN